MTSEARERLKVTLSGVLIGGALFWLCGCGCQERLEDQILLKGQVERKGQQSERGRELPPPESVRAEWMQRMQYTPMCEWPAWLRAEWEAPNRLTDEQALELAERLLP